MIRAEVVQTSARVNPAKSVAVCGTESVLTTEHCSHQILGQGGHALTRERLIGPHFDMAVFLVSFDLKYDDDYSDRYSSFMEQVKKGGKWWADTTSFVAVETDETIDTFCNRIYLQSKFNGTKDLYLVLDANVKSGRVRGALKDQDLFKLLPFVKKL